MHRYPSRPVLCSGLAALCLAAVYGSLMAQEEPERISAPQPLHVTPTAPADGQVPAVYRLTLEEARQRVLANSKLLGLANMNAYGKELAIRIAKADYFPKIIGTSVYFHFDEPLGDVLTIRRGRALLGLPPRVFDVNVFNQDSSFSTLYAAQPITALLLVKQGVRIAEADAQIAQADIQKATLALLIGVDKLYWGLIAAGHIRAGAQDALTAAEKLAPLGTPLIQATILESKEGLQQVEAQIADLQEQLNNLLGLPPCTKLELVEPPMPDLAVTCSEDILAAALANSPDVQQAEADIKKAQAAVKAAKVDYIPNVAVLGGIANQTAANYIQDEFAYVGVVGSYTFLDWGKRRNTLHERENLVAMANLKLSQTQDEVRQRVVKAVREYNEARTALVTATDMVTVRKELEKQAMTPEAMRNPKPLLDASRDRLTAQIDQIKADMNYRVAVAQILNLMGK